MIGEVIVIIEEMNFFLSDLWKVLKVFTFIPLEIFKVMYDKKRIEFNPRPAKLDSLSVKFFFFYLK